MLGFTQRNIKLAMPPLVLIGCVAVFVYILNTETLRPHVIHSYLSRSRIHVSNISSMMENTVKYKVGTRSTSLALQQGAKNHSTVNEGSVKVSPGDTNYTKHITDSKRDAFKSNLKPRRRYLIYLCDKVRSCGGWGDRQRGMVAAYLLAKVTGRQFGINMSYPCDIKMFYVPNKVNWYVKVNDIRGLNWEMVDWMDNRKGIVDVESDFDIDHPSDVIFLKTNQDIINRIKNSPRYGRFVPKEFKDMKHYKIFQTIWHLLMKLSIHFEEHVDMFMNRIPKNRTLICAHVRLRKNPTIPNDGSQINSLSSVDSLWRFVSKHDNQSRVFIASDSLGVRKSARKWFGEREVDTDGLVLHIDRQGKWSNACLGFEMALLDQAILGLCKVLVVSGSNFSIRGAMMSRLKQKLFIFKNGTITPFKL
ncbi:uncharacterized protein [Haliotis cracherodii]|uniref:uncharacterized protein n=1 Tax=Haliotis cracherodii TaxID=6455 RepID=UPI0039ED2DE6